MTRLPREQTRFQAELLEWVEWAEWQADRIDLLKPSPRSLVGDKEKVIRRFQAVGGWWRAKKVLSAR